MFDICAKLQWCWRMLNFFLTKKVVVKFILFTLFLLIIYHKKGSVHPVWQVEESERCRWWKQCTTKEAESLRGMSVDGRGPCRLPALSLIIWMPRRVRDMGSGEASQPWIAAPLGPKLTADARHHAPLKTVAIASPSPSPSPRFVDPQTVNLALQESWVAIGKRLQLSLTSSRMASSRNSVQPSSRYQRLWDLLHHKPVSVRAPASVLWIER